MKCEGCIYAYVAIQLLRGQTSVCLFSSREAESAKHVMGGTDVQADAALYAFALLSILPNGKALVQSKNSAERL